MTVGASPASPPRRGARVVIAAFVVAALAVGAVVALGVFRREDHLARAQAVARDDEQFVTATEAGAAFTRISSLVQAAGELCLDEGPGSCDHLFVAAAYSRVSAVSLLGCTRRGIAEARVALLEHLEAIDERPDTPLPATPHCTS